MFFVVRAHPIQARIKAVVEELKERIADFIQNEYVVMIKYVELKKSVVVAQENWYQNFLLHEMLQSSTGVYSRTIAGHALPVLFVMKAF